MKSEEAKTLTTDQAATAAEQGASVVPAKPTSKKNPSPKTATAGKGQKLAKGKAKTISAKKEAPAAKKAAAAKEPGILRADSKGAKVLALVSRPKCSSLAEIMKATGWQAHSVRGFISGTLGKKLGVKITSAKREDGERIYSLSK